MGQTITRARGFAGFLLDRATPKNVFYTAYWIAVVQGSVYLAHKNGWIGWKDADDKDQVAKASAESHSEGQEERPRKKRKRRQPRQDPPTENSERGLEES